MFAYGAVGSTGTYGGAPGAARSTGTYRGAGATVTFGAVGAMGTFGAAGATGTFGAAGATVTYGAAGATGHGHVRRGRGRINQRRKATENSLDGQIVTPSLSGTPACRLVAEREQGVVASRDLCLFVRNNM